MFTIADDLAEAQANLTRAKIAYQTALDAVSVKSDEGGSMVALERQTLVELEKAVLKARSEVKHFQGSASGIPVNAPMHMGGGLR